MNKIIVAVLIALIGILIVFQINDGFDIFQKSDTEISENLDDKVAMLNQANITLKLTVNSYKCRKTDTLYKLERGMVSVTAFMEINKEFILSQENRDLYIKRDTEIRINEKIEIDKSIQIPLTDFSTIENSEFYIQFTFWEDLDFTKTSNEEIQGRALQEKNYINLIEVLDYLTGNSDANEYATNKLGKITLPNTSNMYLLETKNDKRYVRGFATMLSKNGKIEIDMEYTIELVH